MRLSTVAVPLAMLTCLFISPAFAQDDADSANLKQYIDLVRKDLRAERQSVVDQAMGLEAADKAKFWGVYEKYQKELTAIWDQRIANIKQYAASYEKMDDATADKIAAAAMSNERQALALRQKYYGLIKSALSARVAARFLQVETGLSHVAGLKMSAEIPLVP